MPTPVDQSRVDTLLSRAMELSPEERSSFLDSECSDEPELRVHVERLLDANAATLTLDNDRLENDDVTRRQGPQQRSVDPAVGSGDQTLQPGSRLASYTIKEMLGRGGMGEVYRAFDPKLQRDVAIKLLPPELAKDPERLRRFTSEARALAAIRHPGVVTVHSVEEAAGRHFLTMELLEGGTLASQIPPNGMELDKFSDLAMQLCAALAAAHELGIVHRDLKPGNVLVSPSGTLTLIDFGLVKRGATGAQQAAPAATRATDAETLQRTKTGLVMGTWHYMSPEQARGEDIDARSDVFSLGIVLHQMLSGRRPFERPTNAEVLAAILGENPDPLTKPNEAVPPRVLETIERCLEKDPDRRYRSAAEVRVALEDALPNAVSDRGFSRRTLALAAVAILTLIGIGALALLRGNQAADREQWARTEAIPRALELADQNELAEAAKLTVQAHEVLGDDPVFDSIWPRVSTPYRIRTQPSGANVLVRAYDSEEDWRSLGQTPYKTDRFPVGTYLFRIEQPGFETIQQARTLIPRIQIDEVGGTGHHYLEDPSYVIDLQLVPEGEGHEGMVRVSGGVYGTVPLLGFPPVMPTPTPLFWIDRDEVTNQEYAEFLASSAYSDAETWAQKIVRADTELTPSEAQSYFHDQTGRPGPATFTLGEAPQGLEHHPVGGLSWFEADAYCRWRGKSLPTMFHWARAALPSVDSWSPFNQSLARASNFGGEGVRPSDQSSGVGISGAVDLVGNVREWVSTQSIQGPYLLGGAWSDPTYRLHDVHPTSPWDRDSANGFRCALFEEPVPEPLLRDLSTPEQNFDLVQMPDQVFETQSRMLDYDHSEQLNAVVDSESELPWGAKRQWVSVDTAYGERLPIRIHLPSSESRSGAASLQPIVFVAGGNIIRAREMEEPFPPFDFLVRDGFALIEPVLDGTFQRNEGDTLQRLYGAGRMAFFARWIQDISRTIDYLESRPDIDTSAVSYLGLSLGGVVMPELVAFEPRFAGAVTYSAGFGVQQNNRSISYLISLLQRVEIPVLMLGGENDFSTPPFHQRKMFEALATPEAEKRQVLYETSHWPLPTAEVLRETTTFLEGLKAPKE